VHSGTSIDAYKDSFNIQSTSKGEKQSNIRINEIFMGNSAKIDSQDFIELKFINSEAHKVVKLNHYKILGITFDLLYRRPTLEMVIDLNDFQTNQNGFFTIGGKNVVSDLRVGDDREMYKRKIKFNEQYAYVRSQNIDEDKIPYAILLVMDTLNKIKFNDYCNEVYYRSDFELLLIDNDMIEIIKTTLEDMIIFRSENKGVTTWKYYENLFEPFVYQPYVLKPYSNLKSLSRCDKRPETDYQNFKPHLFMITRETPNSENDCSVGEYVFKTIESSLLLERQVENMDINLYNIPEQSEMGVEYVEQCSSHSQDKAEDEIVYQNLKSKYDYNDTFESVMNASFDDRWLQLIQRYQNEILPINTIKTKNIQWWFEYVFNEQNPQASTYRCKVSIYRSTIFTCLPNTSDSKGFRTIEYQ
jgi:hypothetical protein